MTPALSTMRSTGACALCVCVRVCARAHVCVRACVCVSVSVCARACYHRYGLRESAAAGYLTLCVSIYILGNVVLPFTLTARFGATTSMTLMRKRRGRSLTTLEGRLVDWW